MASPFLQAWPIVTGLPKANDKPQQTDRLAPPNRRCQLGALRCSPGPSNVQISTVRIGVRTLLLGMLALHWALWGEWAAARVYQCTDEAGRLVFSDRPCDGLASPSAEGPYRAGRLHTKPGPEETLTVSETLSADIRVPYWPAEPLDGAPAEFGVDKPKTFIPAPPTATSHSVLRQRDLLIDSRYSLDARYAFLLANRYANAQTYASRLPKNPAYYVRQLERALQDFLEAAGPGHDAVCFVKANLGTGYALRNQRARSESFLSEALTCWKQIPGTSPLSITAVERNLGTLHFLQSRDQEAQPLLRRALATYSGSLADCSDELHDVVETIAIIAVRHGRGQEAEQLIRTLRDRFAAELGDLSFQAVNATRLLADLYFSQGNFEQARDLYLSQMPSEPRSLESAKTASIDAMLASADIHARENRHHASGRLFRDATDGRERQLERLRGDGRVVMLRLLSIEALSGRYVEAGMRLHRLFEAHVGQQWRIPLQAQLAAVEVVRRLLAKDERMAALRLLLDLRAHVELPEWEGAVETLLGGDLVDDVDLHDLAFSLVYGSTDKAAGELAADFMLSTKRAGAAEIELLAKLARSTGDSRILGLIGEIAENRPRIAQASSGSSDAVTQRLLGELGLLTGAELRGANKGQDARGALAYKRYRQQANPSWQQVAAALPKHAALLELKRFHLIDFERPHLVGPRWLAVLIEPANGRGNPPRKFALTATERLDTLLLRLLGNPKGSVSRATASQIYGELFGMLDNILSRYPTLYIAPDGMLDLTPFARLVLPDGRYWLERQAVREVRSGRDLRATEQSPPGRNMLALGGVDFDVYPAAEPRPGNRQAGPGVALSRSLLKTRGALIRPDPHAKTPGFRALPNTTRETRVVAARFISGGHGRAKVLLGSNASEARIKALDAPPRVLHIATHGFFRNRDEMAPGSPLVQTGLALSGANRGIDGHSSLAGEDGLLTALEVQDLNLTGTELVVLSACETGRGEVDRAEGVYDLVRAFQIAGARNVLMTLWQLDDTLAADFMDDFYRIWLTKEGTHHPADALRETQLSWIRSRDPTKSDPRYWAPYVLVERR